MSGKKGTEYFGHNFDANRPVWIVFVSFAICNGHYLVRKVKQRHWLGEADFCCFSGFAPVTIFLAKKFEFVKSYVQRSLIRVGPIFLGHGFLAKQHFSMTPQLRHHDIVSCNCWWNILQFFSHKDCKDDSCQKLWKVVYICRSYDQNTVGPFFPDIVSDMGSDMSVSRTRDIQRQRMAWPWNRGGLSKSLKMAPFDRPYRGLRLSIGPPL